jgi:hypothetical protein
MRRLALVMVGVLGAAGLAGCADVPKPPGGGKGIELEAGVTRLLTLSTRTAGEGILRLRMSGPGTSWLSASATSVVVDAKVDDGAVQSFVLYAGAEPYTYSGFTGALARGSHLVALKVRDDLSSPPRKDATAFIERAELWVVPPGDPSYLAIAHAPVIFGRSVNSHSDTPLLAYADRQSPGDGTTHLTYTQIWSNEDAGTGAFPFALWGTWGRTTDIETSIELTLDAAGAVTAATYQTCAACPPDYPENVAGIDHSFRPFTGFYFAGTHPMLRVATGNNVFNQSGTTPYRFQPALSPPPSPGEVREAAMDPYPVDWRVMAVEMQRERSPQFSTDPTSTFAGDARQYAIVDLDTTPVNAASVGVGLQVAGDPAWYANDYDSGLKFYTGGHRRVAVKLPLNWHARGITAFRLRLYPAIVGVTPTVTVARARVVELDAGYATHQRVLPPPQILTG